MRDDDEAQKRKENFFNFEMWHEWVSEGERKVFIMSHISQQYIQIFSKALSSAHATTTLTELCEEDSKKIRIHLYANLLTI